MYALSVRVSFIFVAISASFVQCVPSINDDVTDGVLTVHFLDKDMVLGSYMVPGLDCGIHFNSTTDSLAVTNLNGSILFNAEESVGPARFINIGGKKFLQHHSNNSEATDYAIPDSLGHLTGTRDHNALFDLVNELERFYVTMNGEHHSRVMKESLKSVHSSSEVHLLKDAAHALGNAGITGQVYPGILPFHMIALRIESAKGNNFEATDSLHSNVATAADPLLTHSRSKRLASCYKTCPPSCDSFCIGMCGRLCDCWRFICGDCCYHKGCFYHDLCCAEFWSSRCLFPFGFKCNKKYKC